MHDIHLHYIEKGSGKPLILLHGNGEDSRYFKHQIRFFSRSRRVLAVDTRGHGKTKRVTKPFTIRQFAEDLAVFLKEKGIHKADIIGFSDGGNIAIIFAIRFPEKVENLILNGANLYPAGMKLWAVFPVWMEYGLLSLVTRFCGRGKRRQELLRLMIKDPYIRPSDLRKIRSRTLVIVGTHDMIRDRHSRFMADQIPGATFVCLKGDHFLAAKRPQIFNWVVKRFLEEETFFSVEKR